MTAGLPRTVYQRKGRIHPPAPQEVDLPHVLPISLMHAHAQHATASLPPPQSPRPTSGLTSSGQARPQHHEKAGQFRTHDNSKDLKRLYQNSSSPLFSTLFTFHFLAEIILHLAGQVHRRQFCNPQTSPSPQLYTDQRALTTRRLVKTQPVRVRVIQMVFLILLHG